MMLKIFKDKILALQKTQYDNKNISKLNKNPPDNVSKLNEENENKIPQFMTLSKLDWDNNEIHAGIIKDPTAKGGLRYQVIEPELSERDQNAFEIIKKLLITELSVSLGEIKSKKEAELNNFARKMAYIYGKHVSIADPIIDASLPGGSRINLTLGHEITKRGSTFTIRRFRADPITVIDLIKFGTMSVDIAAYMWYLAEKRATMLIAGGTASGKTTALNALATFIRPG